MTGYWNTDTSQFDNDFQREVGQVLRHGSLHVLYQYTSHGHPQHSVSYMLDCGVNRGLARQNDHHQLEGYVFFRS
jgi:hypothetical protein